MKKKVTFNSTAEAFQFFADKIEDVESQVESLKEEVFAQKCIIDLLQKGGRDSLDSDEYWVHLLNQFSSDLRDFGAKNGGADYANRISTLIEEFATANTVENFNFTVIDGGRSED